MVPFRLFARKCLFTIAAGLSVTSVAANVSLAQLFLPNAVAWPGLTQDSLDRMNAAAARLYEGRSIGTVERWRNPELEGCRRGQTGAKVQFTWDALSRLLIMSSGFKPRGIAQLITLPTGARSKAKSGRSLSLRRPAKWNADCTTR